jgi:DNA-directed RNA polymerase subunit RPC12/RpoP
MYTAVKVISRIKITCQRCGKKVLNGYHIYYDNVDEPFKFVCVKCKQEKYDVTNYKGNINV